MLVPRLRLVGAAAVLSAAACSSGPPPSQTPPPPAAKRVDESKAGGLAGRVLIEGVVPRNAALKMGSDPYCSRESPPGATSEAFAVQDGGLDNVFVYVKDGLGDYQFDVPSEPVTLDQKGCRYAPHVFGVRAGQPIEISNSDQTLHNVHALAQINQEFNIGQAMAGMKNTRTFTVPEVMVTFKCDVHGWMNAYAGVMAHPYFAVTSSGGRFELKNLPSGTYTIEAWHEKLGTRAQSVTVGDRETREVSFTFKATAS
jgi:plastocyanin